MELNFGRSAPFTVGIEEEFQILSAESYELVQRYEEVAEAAADERLRPELMKSTVEVATHIARTVPEAAEGAADLRRTVREAAADRDALIAAAGTHPFSRWEHQEITEAERYEKIREGLRWVAERVLIFGLHVHVGIASPHQAIAVANALRTWLPELVALSANSPFWHGRDTGLASTRSKVFDTMPRSGLPPAFASWEEFELMIERATKAGFFRDYTFLWWDVRPHPKLGTLELRVCDAQTRLASVGAIAALFQSLVATLAERFERDGSLPIQPYTLIAENKWRAVRYGLDARLVDLERDEERPARAAVADLLDSTRAAAAHLGCADDHAAVEALLERGTGADEQRRIHADGGSLLAVAQWLAAETGRGL
jgi:glutamate---cysteine ligase / carboxylate-amine ligase